MNVNEISALISSVGFPIVACIFMYIQQAKLNETIRELSATLKAIDTRLDTMEEKLNKWRGYVNILFLL